MTTFALVGAGPGLGLATARRFGTAGHGVALIARSALLLCTSPEGKPCYLSTDGRGYLSTVPKD
ncbi:hypothetical protein [Streptomyces yanii]|uniref:hypothetical protein n=1 Tax=Streptomyces yanii TaxID=78510 RepID=UPI00337DBF2E